MSTVVLFKTAKIWKKSPSPMTNVCIKIYSAIRKDEILILVTIRKWRLHMLGKISQEKEKHHVEYKETKPNRQNQTKIIMTAEVKLLREAKQESEGQKCLAL